MKPSRSILIAGGGIAGLAAALSAAKAGFRVDLFESAKKFQPIGSGIQLGPNAYLVLEALGLSRTLQSVANVPDKIDLKSAYDAKTINQVPLGTFAREKYGAPYLILHRADLHQVLLSACQNEPDLKIHMGHAVDDFTLHRNGVSLIANNSNEIKTYSGLFLLIADGVKSNLRGRMFENAKSVNHSGFEAWRGMLPAANIPDSISMDRVHLYMARKSHAVLYPVSHKNYLNMVFICESDEKKYDTIFDAGISGLKSNLFPEHEKMRWDGSFNELLSDKIKWSVWPILQAPTINKWGMENVLAIGDAAHGLPPFAGQGAALAIEDAFEIVRLLKSGGDMQKIQIRFHNRRLRRTKRIKALVRANQRAYHMGKPLNQVRNLILKNTPSKLLLARQDWIYNWKPSSDHID